MGLIKIICDEYRFYKESFQPHMKFGIDEDGIGEYIIRFGPKISFGMHGQGLKNIEVWVHEFIEFCIQKLLIEYGAVGNIAFLYKKDLEYFVYNHEVSHIVASSTGKSGLDGRNVDADTYWNEVMEKYSKRKPLSLPCLIKRCMMSEDKLYDWVSDSLCDHY